MEGGEFERTQWADQAMEVEGVGIMGAGKRCWKLWRGPERIVCT